MLKVKSQLRIKVENKWNRFVSNIINNRVSNRIKEILSIGMDYPLFLYSDVTGDYLREFNPTWDAELDAWKDEIVFASAPEGASDYRHLWFWQKNKLLKALNEAVAQDPDKRQFRWKRVLTIKKEESS